MNVAHDFDRADKDTIAADGRCWMISSKVSTGSEESIVQVVSIVWLRTRSWSDQHRAPAPPDVIRPEVSTLLPVGRSSQFYLGLSSSEICVYAPTQACHPC